jgi:hypothetical protein
MGSLHGHLTNRFYGALKKIDFIEVEIGSIGLLSLIKYILCDKNSTNVDYYPCSFLISNFVFQNNLKEVQY